MHKCVNNTVGNVYHLEQMVDNFFPYSQKKLGFDKGATIVFQSDQDNAGRMLGKTAYYDPENYQIVLYTDGRHPKDILRSLSHELVHHAQNCRGDFTRDNPTYEGYAQKDPHLREMEREAYEKGNLIFRDFEDLIKTGKINVEIDFSETGEPKMSLKEWKNNEINTKLMKKWGLLNEGVPEVSKDELDSDDVLLPDAADIIRSHWTAASKKKEMNWLLNSRWFDPAKVNDFIENENYHGGEHQFDQISTFGDSVKIAGLRGKFQEVGIEDYMKKSAAFAMNIIHKSSINVRWRDSVTGIPGGVRPDSAFLQRLLKFKGGVMNNPYYVRCHHSNLWDC